MSIDKFIEHMKNLQLPDGEMLLFVLLRVFWCYLPKSTSDHEGLNRNREHPQAWTQGEKCI